MKPYVANFINAILLIALGTWGYFGSDESSNTALIPVAVGVILLIMNFWMKKENKVVAHIVVILTLLILIAFVKPLSGAIGRSDTMAILRVVVMMVSSFMAMFFYIRSFMVARKKP